MGDTILKYITRDRGHMLLSMHSFPALIPVLDTINYQSHTT